MTTSDERHARWRSKANARGFSVLGLNGEKRAGCVIGGTARGKHGDREYARIYVADVFAPICFPIKWETVEAIANGYVNEIRIRPDKDVLELLGTAFIPTYEGIMESMGR